VPASASSTATRMHLYRCERKPFTANSNPSLISWSHETSALQCYPGFIMQRKRILTRSWPRVAAGVKLRLRRLCMRLGALGARVQVYTVKAGVR